MYGEQRMIKSILRLYGMYSVVISGYAVCCIVHIGHTHLKPGILCSGYHSRHISCKRETVLACRLPVYHIIIMRREQRIGIAEMTIRSTQSVVHVTMAKSPHSRQISPVHILVSRTVCHRRIIS